MFSSRRKRISDSRYRRLWKPVVFWAPVACALFYGLFSLSSVAPAVQDIEKVLDVSDKLY